MKLYRTTLGVFVQDGPSCFRLPVQSWDELICSNRIEELTKPTAGARAVSLQEIGDLLPPITTQDVWAAGVTYFRSRNARMEESKVAGGGSFYDRVYEAERPELFFKSTGKRVVGPGAGVRIRSDATWSVPEPELTLVINPSGSIIGYTAGNDMSSRDIEGENPLYLPQAKVYDGSCALGPCVLLAKEPLPSSTGISMEIVRGETTVFSAATSLKELKRKPEQLVEYLFRENSFPDGAYLMTGTGIVPEDDFTLRKGDVVRITIDGIGTLQNYVL